MKRKILRLLSCVVLVNGLTTTNAFASQVSNNKLIANSNEKVNLVSLSLHDTIKKVRKNYAYVIYDKNKPFVVYVSYGADGSVSQTIYGANKNNDGTYGPYGPEKIFIREDGTYYSESENKNQNPVKKERKNYAYLIYDENKPLVVYVSYGANGSVSQAVYEVKENKDGTYGPYGPEKIYINKDGSYILSENKDSIRNERKNYAYVIYDKNKPFVVYVSYGADGSVSQTIYGANKNSDGTSGPYGPDKIYVDSSGKITKK
ncbi:hypothetical protein ACSXC5_16590 (plasmid) [Clostridium perfringens]|uniref:Uncharacterized protein n=9 Tax=Clostridium perfringens TaxID=1502 RepID=A0A0N7BKT4_CLOPF|nr:MULTISPECIES: hypothetical protein [Clostridium]AKF16644.1 hypothetical protein [Clostridium perfringens]AMN30636.1 hypothetical protein JFP838_pC0054 [Clostridium perfringens]MDK7591269.1 hypothetical protein [Clostridium sp. UMB9555B]MDK7629604.1 hypothetical protein [Clostridium sp. UMB9555A]